MPARHGTRNASEQDRLLTPHEVAELARVSYHAVVRAINAGELQASKLRGRLRVRHSAYEAWIDEHTVVPATRAVTFLDTEQRRLAKAPRSIPHAAKAARRTPGDVDELTAIEREASS